MTNRSLFGLLSLVVVPVLVGCNQADVRDPSIEPPRDFTVEISGTEGLVVDLLVVVKPDANSIEKPVDEEVTIPFKRQFRGVKYAAWVDASYKGQDGEYTLRIGRSTASGVVGYGGKDQSCLYNL